MVRTINSRNKTVPILIAFEDFDKCKFYQTIPFGYISHYFIFNFLMSTFDVSESESWGAFSDFKQQRNFFLVSKAISFYRSSIFLNLTKV